MLNLLSRKALQVRLPVFSFIQAPRRTYISDFDQTGIPEQPEKSLFSSLIRAEFTPEETKQLEKEYSLKFGDQNKSNELRAYKKSKNFDLTRTDYTKIVQENPVGKVNVFTYKDTKFTLVGPQYEFTPIKNIYKILTYSKPSVIVLQARPDQILKSINLHPSNKANKFSSSQYFSQLVHKPSNIMPSKEVRSKVYNELLNSGILVDENVDDNVTKYKTYEARERVSTEAIAAACLYAENKGIDIILGDLPELVFRQNIVNTHTLLQLQNIFTHCARELAYYPDLRPQTPYTMACLLYPEVFVKPSDKYMSTMFEYMIHKGHKNILGLLGYNQSETLTEYLDKRKVSHFEDELKLEPMMKSIVRDIQGEEILEKHALLDVLFHGDDVLKKMESINFKTTYAMIKKHADPQHVDYAKKDQFRVLHYQFLVKYHAYFLAEIGKGKVTLRREFLSKMGV